MTKTELRKTITKSIMEMLVKDFNAYHFGEEMGGRITFWLDTKLGNNISGEYHRSNMDVCIVENCKLAGNGWTVDEINKAAEAGVYEGKINKKIKEIVSSLGSLRV